MVEDSAGNYSLRAQDFLNVYPGFSRETKFTFVFQVI